jgi:hypothetical protein
MTVKQLTTNLPEKINERGQVLSAEAWGFRLGAIGAVAGSLLAGIGNLLHPATPVGQSGEVARAIAQSTVWVPVHLMIVAGLILMFAGLVAFSRSIRGGLAGALAQFGYVAAIAGITIGVLLVMVDGVAAKHLADVWATAPQDQRETALRLVLAEESLNFAIASAFNIVFAGVTYILLGLAVALSRVYPRLLGWVAVVMGLGCVVAGLIQALTGEPTLLTKTLTIVFPTVITLWTALLGVLLWRSPLANGASVNCTDTMDEAARESVRLVP